MLAVFFFVILRYEILTLESDGEYGLQGWTGPIDESMNGLDDGIDVFHDLVESRDNDKKEVQ